MGSESFPVHINPIKRIRLAKRLVPSFDPLFNSGGHLGKQKCDHLRDHYLAANKTGTNNRPSCLSHIQSSGRSLPHRLGLMDTVTAQVSHHHTRADKLLPLAQQGQLPALPHAPIAAPPSLPHVTGHHIFPEPHLLCLHHLENELCPNRARLPCLGRFQGLHLRRCWLQPC